MGVNSMSLHKTLAIMTSVVLVFICEVIKPCERTASSAWNVHFDLETLATSSGFGIHSPVKAIPLQTCKANYKTERQQYQLTKHGAPRLIDDVQAY